MQRNQYTDSNDMRGPAAGPPVRSIYNILLIEPNDFQRGDSSALTSNNLQRDTTTSASSVPRRRRNVMDLGYVLNPSGPLTVTTTIDHGDNWQGTALQPLPGMQVRRLLSFTLEPQQPANLHTAEANEVVDEMGRAWLARDTSPYRPASTHGAEAGAAGPRRDATPATPKQNVWPPTPLTPISPLSLAEEVIGRRPSDMSLPKKVWLGPAPKERKVRKAERLTLSSEEISQTRDNVVAEDEEVDDDEYDADSESSPATPTHPIFCFYMTESPLPLPLTPDEWPGVHPLANGASWSRSALDLCRQSANWTLLDASLDEDDNGPRR